MKMRKTMKRKRMTRIKSIRMRRMKMTMTRMKMTMTRRAKADGSIDPDSMAEVSRPLTRLCIGEKLRLCQTDEIFGQF